MTVGQPEGVSVGLSDKLATIGVLEGDVFQGGYLVAAWHREHADGFQIAVVLPGPAGALPQPFHITVQTGEGPEALKAWR